MDVLVRGRLTTLRPADGDDVDRLVAWHADPEVSRYWDDETFTRAQTVERLARPDVDAWIVEENGEPVGYLQSWTDDGETSGLDMFLVPAARGRRLGPDAARALALHLLDEVGRTRVTVDPYSWNEGAIRGWQRAGFVEVGRQPPRGEQSAETVQMEFRR